MIKRNIIFILSAMICFNLYPESTLKINTNYYDMPKDVMSKEWYTFLPGSKIENAISGGDYFIRKGNYSISNKKSSKIITITYTAFNYGAENDVKYDKPEILKYFITTGNDLFILHSRGKEKYDYYHGAFSYNKDIYLDAEYKASSTLIEDSKQKEMYAAKNLGVYNTLYDFWSEGKKGYGENESIEIKFIIPEFIDEEYYNHNGNQLPAKADIKGLVVFNGIYRTQDLYNKNSRVKTAELIFSNGTKETILLQDTPDAQIILLKNKLTGITKVNFIIRSVYKGEKWDDTCITKIIFYGQYPADL